MKALFLVFACLLSVARAASCEELLAAIPAAFEQAEEVVMATELRVAGREFAYRRERLYRTEDGTWASEVLEERGQRRPMGTDDGSAEPDFAFDCEGAELEVVGGGWALHLPEQDAPLPVKTWTLLFTLTRGHILPEEVRGELDAHLLFIPIGGAFSVRFSAWRLGR